MQRLAQGRDWAAGLVPDFLNARAGFLPAGNRQAEMDFPAPKSNEHILSWHPLEIIQNQPLTLTRHCYSDSHALRTAREMADLTRDRLARHAGLKYGCAGILFVPFSCSLAF